MYINSLRKNNVQFKEKIYTHVYKEFIYRSAYFFLCCVLSCTSAWIYRKEILFIYLHPLYRVHQNIMFTSISEAFTTTLGLCISYGLAASIPFFFYLFFCFFCTSLFPEEKSKLSKACFSVLCAYIIGLGFCSSYVIPELCLWFLKYEVSTSFLALSLQAKASSYISWSGKMYVLCVCVFQIPNVISLYFFFRNLFDNNKTFSFRQRRLQSKKTSLQEKHNKRHVVATESLSVNRKPQYFAQVTKPSQTLQILSENSIQAPKKSEGFYNFKGIFKNRWQSSVCLLLLCATISPPDVYSQGLLFAFFLSIYEISLWYRFLQETANFYRKKKVFIDYDKFLYKKNINYNKGPKKNLCNLGLDSKK